MSFQSIESAVQLCPFPTPYSVDIHSLPGQDGKLKSVTYCKHCSVSTKNRCLVNVILILTLKHSSVLPARKKIDSIPAETRQGRKTIVLLFVVIWFGLVLGFSSAFQKGYLNWKFEVEKKINNGGFLLQHTRGVHHEHFNCTCGQICVFAFERAEEEVEATTFRFMHLKCNFRYLNLLSLRQIFPK